MSDILAPVAKLSCLVKCRKGLLRPLRETQAPVGTPEAREVHGANCPFWK